MDTPCKPSIRPMYAWEIQEARRVFGSSLRYEQVRIHECATWPNTINRIGTRLKGMEYVEVHNAITLGNHCYFPIKLLEMPAPLGHPEHYKIGWLIHELTHAWQYQHIGLRYLTRALAAQFKYKELAYEYGGAEGLTQRRQEGWSFHNYNPEQQGNITQGFYYRKRKGWDLTAWEPYIADVHSTPAPGSAR